MLSLIPDNTDLLHLSSTLRVDLEFLIYTIESHRSLTGGRYAKARARFASALVEFLDKATTFQYTDSNTSGSGSDSKSSISHALESPGIPPIAGALPDFSREESHSSIYLEKKIRETPKSLREEPITTPVSEIAGNDQRMTQENSTESKGAICPDHKFTHEYTILTKSAHSQVTSSNIEGSQEHIGGSTEENSTILIHHVPSRISRASILAQVCGGPVEGIEVIPYKETGDCDVSITFVQPTAARDYLNYVNTPDGKLTFPGFSGWEFHVSWNFSPSRMNSMVTYLARDPYIQARRCVVIKDFPNTIDAGMMRLRLSKLKGTFSQDIEVQRIFIDRKFGEAKIVMDKISCALQLMQSKYAGDLGEDFEDCSLEYGEDDCDRPIPGTMGKFPSIINKHAAERLSKSYSHFESDKDSSCPFNRTLYIPELPSTITISELVSQLRGGPLERVILIKHKRDEGLAGCITFVHPSSANTCRELLNSPEGKLRFSGVIWDWPVSWDRNFQDPIRTELLEKILDPAVRARRGFVIKNFPSKEVLVETLKADALSQSQHILSFEKFEVNRTKREGKVIMATVGAAVGAIKSIKRLQRYRGCKFEYLKDACEDPIDCVENSDSETFNDVIDVITQCSNHPTTLVIKDLPASIKLSELSACIRGGALDSIQVHCHGVRAKTTALVKFLDNKSAQSYLDYIMRFPNPPKNVSWRPKDVSNVTSYSDKEARRVLIMKGFPSAFTNVRIITEIKRVVKTIAWKLKDVDQKRVIESISVRGDEKKEAKVIMASIKLAVVVKAEIPRPWEARFGRDMCEGNLEQLTLLF